MEELKNSIKCHGCGAILEYKPGTTQLVCPYCGATQEIEIDEEKVRKANEEIEINSGFSVAEKEIPEPKTFEYKCEGCGAILEIKDDTIATVCPYCQNPIVLPPEKTNRKIQPQGLIPFAVNKKQAKEIFVKWAQKRFWAPSKFKKYVRTPQKLKGTYVPLWTFDADTYTTYSGERGIDYTVEDTYTDSEGNEITTTRVETRWTPVSGSVSVSFDDVQIPARRDIKMITSAPQWNTKELIHFEPKVISGFECKAYTVPLPKAFDSAKKIMELDIVQAIRRDIGGDHQRIHNYDVTFSDVTYKHILVPLWHFSYQYKKKTYSVVINGQTGELSGKYPISTWKIILAILLVLIILAIIALGSNNWSFSGIFHNSGFYFEQSVQYAFNNIADKAHWI